MDRPSPPSVAIVGAGLTGLVAAYRLQAGGLRVKVFEASARTGGAVRTLRENGWLVESGPNSLQYGAPEVKRLVADLGLEAELLVAGGAARKRFVVRGGRLVPVPLGPVSFLASPLFGGRTKLAVVAELFSRPRVRPEDVSLAEFVRSHFTQELVDYAVNPVVAGIYAGDPEKLSVRHAFPSLEEAERTSGSLPRGMWVAAKARRAAGERRAGPPPIVSFRRGLQQLTDALAARLPPGTLELGTAVEGILPGRPHRLVGAQGSALPGGDFDFVVLALPAPALARLTLGASGARPLAALADVVHPPVASLFLGFRRDQVAHPLDGFGGLAPEVERRDVLGVLFSSTLFPGRAPAGHVALTVFAGGVRQPELAGLDAGRLLERVRRDLAALVGATGDPVFFRHSVWPRAIPQYELGYDRFLEVMARVEEATPGLLLGGQARDGISLADCCRAGERLASRVAAQAAPA